MKSWAEKAATRTTMTQPAAVVSPKTLFFFHQRLTTPLKSKLMNKNTSSRTHELARGLLPNGRREDSAQLEGVELLNFGVTCPHLDNSSKSRPLPEDKTQALENTQTIAASAS